MASEPIPSTPPPQSVPATTALWFPPMALSHQGVANVQIVSPVNVLTQKDAEPFWADASFWTAIAAVLLSIVAMLQARNQQKDSRARSIHDDFWLRSVMYERSVRPVCDFFEALASTIPCDSSDLDWKAKSVSDYFNEFRHNYSEVHRCLMRVGALNEELYTDLRALLEELEEAVTIYCEVNKSQTKNDGTSSKDQVKGLIIDLESRFFKRIMVYQKTLT